MKDYHTGCCINISIIQVIDMFPVAHINKEKLFISFDFMNMIDQIPPDCHMDHECSRQEDNFSIS